MHIHTSLARSVCCTVSGRGALVACGVCMGCFISAIYCGGPLQTHTCTIYVKLAAALNLLIPTMSAYTLSAQCREVIYAVQVDRL
jgi:hypothetical protein